MLTTHPTASDLQSAFKKVLTSAVFAKFVGQAVQAAFEEHKNQIDGIVLTPKQTTRVRFSDRGCACSYEARSKDGNSEIRMQRSFETLNAPELRHQWYGAESHTDTLGRTWSRSLPHMVQDDFGVLVEVAL